MTQLPTAKSTVRRRACRDTFREQGVCLDCVQAIHAVLVKLHLPNILGHYVSLALRHHTRQVPRHNLTISCPCDDYVLRRGVPLAWYGKPGDGKNRALVVRQQACTGAKQASCGLSGKKHAFLCGSYKVVRDTLLGQRGHMFIPVRMAGPSKSSRWCYSHVGRAHIENLSDEYCMHIPTSAENKAFQRIHVARRHSAVTGGS
jgi:hypothetical protein